MLLITVFVTCTNVFIPGLRGNTTIIPPTGSSLGCGKWEASRTGPGQQEICGLTGS